MLQKLFIKVSILFFLLASVLGASRFLGSSDFKNSVNLLFGLNPSQTLRWCPDNTVDLEWVDQNIPTNWKNARSQDIQKHFCEIDISHPTIAISPTTEFKKLLIARSAEAKTATLEWNSESKLFKSQDMLFFSTILTKELFAPSH
jgi:hypothetical protein